MRFTKMHGAGNDYVYVNCFDQTIDGDIAELARRISNRHTGVGGDGLIFIRLFFIRLNHSLNHSLNPLIKDGQGGGQPEAGLWGCPPLPRGCLLR